LTVYHNQASDQLVGYDQPIQTGFGNITSNAPYVVSNRGFEISVSSRNLIARNLQWTSSCNIFHNANRLDEFQDYTTSPYRLTYIPGKPLNAVPLLPFVGVDPATGIFNYKKADGTLTPLPNAVPAFNGVGGDMTEWVDPAPKYSGSLTNTLTWKGVSLSLVFQFTKQKGRNERYSIYVNTLTDIPGRPNINVPAILAGRWRKPGDDSPYQRLSASTLTDVDRTVDAAADAITVSTGAWSDASWIRLRTLSLTWTLPNTWTGKLHVQACNLFLNAQNLLLITGYKIGDPETQYLYAIPPQRTIVAGIGITM